MSLPLNSSINYEDCYVGIADNTITIGNSLIERKIRVLRNTLYTLCITDKSNGLEWKSYDKLYPMINIGIDFEGYDLSVTAEATDYYHTGFMGLCLRLHYSLGDSSITVQFLLFPRSPFITSSVKSKNAKIDAQNPYQPPIISKEENVDPYFFSPLGTIDAFPINKTHLKLTTVVLNDVTDYSNTLVEEAQELLYVRGNNKKSGQLFLIDSYLDNTSIMVVKEAPSKAGRVADYDYDINIRCGDMVEVCGAGMDFAHYIKDEYHSLYSCTIGVGRESELIEEYKQYYSDCCMSIRNKTPYIMSNTWGDRSQDAALCEKFILDEIDALALAGGDVLQIDDGWQKGITVNSKLSKNGVWSSGFYNQDSHFWEVDSKKFPNGFEKIIEYAKAKSIRIGLWFSPDAYMEYRYWERDLNTILNLWKTYSVAFFKLDGINITSKLCEINFLKFIQNAMNISKGKITFNFDITAQKRLGYLYYKEYGTIFVENRYTDWGNYYPHLTLRNLWMVSKYLPAQKFQFELLNKARNIEKYQMPHCENPLAPIHYKMDYLFASVMFSNPLLWMEVSNLNDADKLELKNIVGIYKKYREGLAGYRVVPIGQKPDGRSFTGLMAIKGKEVYFLLFKEYCQEDEYCYIHKSPVNLKLEVLYKSDPDITVENDADKIIFKSAKNFSFVFLKGDNRYQKDKKEGNTIERI